MNLSKELKKLFNDYLNRLEDEKSNRYKTTPSYHCGGQQRLLFDDDEFSGVIYFYEWSDITRAPKTYWSLTAFERFLDSCGIYLVSWQREVMSHMHCIYVCCMEGKKTLVIKPTYDSLRQALSDLKKNGNKENVSNPFKSTGAPGFNPNPKKAEPYQVGITRVPYVGRGFTEKHEEVEARYPEFY
jgi:hypothetical protein